MLSGGTLSMRSPRERRFAMIGILQGCGRPWVGCLDRPNFFLVGAAFGEDFTTTEEIGHGVAADGAGLPGGDDGGEFLRVHSFGAEVGVEFDQDFVRADVLRGILSGAPPIDPSEDLSERLTDAGGETAEDAVLARLPELDGLSGFA